MNHFVLESNSNAFLFLRLAFFFFYKFFLFSFSLGEIIVKRFRTLHFLIKREGKEVNKNNNFD